MAVVSQPNQNMLYQQQPGGSSDLNSRTYTTLTDVPIYTNNEMTREQQIVYYNPSVSNQLNYNSLPHLYMQPSANSQMVNHLPIQSVVTHQYQQQEKQSSINAHNSMIQEALIHSNTTQHQVPSSLYQPHVNLIATSTSSMSNPTGSSTPVSASIKRGRNNTSGLSESNVQLRPQFAQITRIFNSNNTPNKRLRGTTQQQTVNDNMTQGNQNQLGTGNESCIGVGAPGVPRDNKQQPSVAACRYATTRFPFSPYSVIFSQKVREKIVVEDLIKFAKENYNFELKTLAYRHAWSENNEHRILIFVENCESFSFLHDRNNWPATLAGLQFSIKCPSMPPQLALVLPSVSLQIDWDDFVEEVKEKYSGIANVIRLKNKAQQPVRSVKLEFRSPTLRNQVLETGEISVMHMKLKVVEYYSQANVLICSNCFGIGHFRKNCPQKNEVTCKTCGEKCSDLKEHHCSGILKCIHCGGSHSSNDAKCRVVKDYRAVLTRNLLANAAPIEAEKTSSRQMLTNRPPARFTNTQQSYASIAQTSSLSSQQILFEKLDAVIAKVEEESTATRRSFEELKEDMKSRYEETKEQVKILENRLSISEKKFHDLSMRTLTIIQNICTSLLDPHGSNSTNWKSYWQEQIGSLAEIRSTLYRPTE